MSMQISIIILDYFLYILNCFSVQSLYILQGSCFLGFHCYQRDFARSTAEFVRVSLLAPVSCEPASSQTSVYETDPPQVDNFEHLKCFCIGTDMQYLLHNGQFHNRQIRLILQHNICLTIRDTRYENFIKSIIDNYSFTLRYSSWQYTFLTT